MMLMAAERGKWAQQRAGEPVAGRGLMSGWHGAKRNDWTERAARRVRGSCCASPFCPEPISIRAFRRSFSTELIISHLHIATWKAACHGKGAAVDYLTIHSISAFYKHLHGRPGS
jgi:hypothetical protein